MDKRTYQREYQRKFRQTPKGRAHVRRMNLRSKGVTPEWYDAKLAEQNGVCAACHQPETAKHQGGTVNSLPVDHDHETGQLRGLLCHACNRALGLLGDDPARVEALLIYRRSFN